MCVIKREGERGRERNELILVQKSMWQRPRVHKHLRHIHILILIAVACTAMSASYIQHPAWSSNMPSRVQIFLLLYCSFDRCPFRSLRFVGAHFNNVPRLYCATHRLLCQTKNFFNFGPNRIKIYWFTFIPLYFSSSSFSRSLARSLAGWLAGWLPPCGWRSRYRRCVCVSCLHSPTFKYAPDAHRTRIWFILFSVRSSLHRLLFARTLHLRCAMHGEGKACLESAGELVSNVFQFHFESNENDNASVKSEKFENLS